MQVALDTLAPTLYYAVVEGNIMSVKIPATPSEGVVIEPYDMGVSAGQHMFNILCHDNKLYCLDAGKQFYYINDADGVLGDGQITIMAADASTIETMISNVGGHAFQDPFFGYIENGNRRSFLTETAAILCENKPDLIVGFITYNVFDIAIQCRTNFDKNIT